MNDQELREYLRLMFDTTFLLDDGTRLKVLSVDWDALTAEQRDAACSWIRQMCAGELRALGSGSRLRIEFNEIPAGLAETLVDLGGRGNADFEWGRVSTE